MSGWNSTIVDLGKQIATATIRSKRKIATEFAGDI
jgi:hypothetical protein